MPTASYTLPEIPFGRTDLRTGHLTSVSEEESSCTSWSDCIDPQSLPEYPKSIRLPAPRPSRYSFLSGCSIVDSRSNSCIEDDDLHALLVPLNSSDGLRCPSIDIVALESSDLQDTGQLVIPNGHHRRLPSLDCSKPSRNTGFDDHFYQPPMTDEFDGDIDVVSGIKSTYEARTTVITDSIYKAPYVDACGRLKDPFY